MVPVTTNQLCPSYSQPNVDFTVSAATRTCLLAGEVDPHQGASFVIPGAGKAERSGHPTGSRWNPQGTLREPSGNPQGTL